MTEVGLDVYGLRARVAGWAGPVASVGLDFAWFEATGGGPPTVEIAVEQAEPDFDALGEATAAFITPRNVVYQQGERKIVDYFGRAVSVLERSGGVERLTVQGTDEHLVHEAAYLYLLSRVGQHLDERGLPRLHALGLAGAQGAVAVLLPSGGGKSTLAVRALRADGVRLLSEDSPLLDAEGRLYPFPLRIGVNATDAERLGAAHVRRIERMEFHPKLVLDVEAFRDRIEPAPQPLRHLVVGRRALGRSASLTRSRRTGAAGVLLREAVVGVGIYQGMEFVLQRGLADTARMAPVALTRARACAAALRSAQVWELELGRDHERNWAALAPLLGTSA